MEKKRQAKAAEHLSRAVFVDRDGVLNDLIFDRDDGRVSSPYSARQLRVFPHAAAAVKAIRREGFKVIVISNQPGVAKGQFTLAEHEKMNEKIRRTLAESGASLDAEYYCLHHPEGTVAEYAVTCDCRKPKPGLLLRAAEEQGVDLSESYFVGDGLVDVEAGKRAGCSTILAGRMTTFLGEVMEREGVEPDYMVHTLADVLGLIRSIEKRTKKQR